MRRYGGQVGDQAGNQSSGPNDGGPGAGQRPDPDETLDSGFKPEKSRSDLQAGKILLQWKTKEVSEAGESKQEYLKNIQNVKQGVSEAIKQEQVPAGYRDGIQKYFDAIEADAAKAAGKSSSSQPVEISPPAK